MTSRRVAWAVAIAATLTMTVSYVDRQTFAVLAPTVTKALDISDTGYGWLISVFSVGYLIATPLCGWWIDRVGARRGLVISLLVWSAITGLHSLALGFGTMLVLRIGLGLAEGPGFPGAAQTMQRVLPPGDRARGFGLLFTGSSIGGMIAPPLAALLFAHGGWRIAFLGTAVIGLCWLPVWRMLTRRGDVRALLDAPAQVAARPSSVRALLANPIMMRALLGIFAVAPVLGFCSSWGAKYLVRELGMTQVGVGHFLWVPPLMLDLGAFGFGDLASRQQRPAGAPPRLLYAIGALLAACLALLPIAADPWAAVEFLGMAMAGGGAIYALTTADALARVPPDTVALSSGILACGQSLALIITAPLVGACVDHFHGYAEITTLLAAWVIPGTIAWIVWPVRGAAR